MLRCNHWRSWSSQPFLALGFSLVFSLLLLIPIAQADSCVDCHKDPNFRVTNKKLYDYYQNWTGSIHAQEDISCSDCHGGNPKLSSKKTAHASSRINPSVATSPVHFKNIPKTCANCHEEYYNHFRQSTHFKKLQNSKETQQGPNCVTCHASVNTAVLNVNTVREACAFCHNEEKDNHPEIPAKAEKLLSQFLSIHRFYRFVTVRGNLDRAVFDAIETRTSELFIDWHTFDLPTIEKRTEKLLAFLKTQRDIIRKKPKK